MNRSGDRYGLFYNRGASRTNTRVLFAIMLAVALSVVSGSFANAQIIAYEGFDFTAARLDGSIACRGTDLAGWYPYGGWGDCNISVPEGSGMTYSNLVTKGNAAVGVVGTSSDIRAYRDLADRYTDGEFWISFLLFSNATGYDYAYANLNLCDSQFPYRNGERVAFGFTYRHTQEYGQRWEPDVPGHGYKGTGIIRKDGPALVVVRYDFGTGYDGSSSLYIDPPLGPDPPASPNAYEDGIEKWKMPFDRIRVELHQDPAGSLLKLDEIRIGRSWADVTPVPEPSTLLLLSMGAVGLLAYAWGRQKRTTS